MALESVLKEISNELHGSRANEDDVNFLKSNLPLKLIPIWFIDMLRKHKLGGVVFLLSEGNDKSKLGADLLWLRPHQIVSEACSAEPGVSVLQSGLLPIGVCANGSGDPYFLDFREASPDPPVVRVPHEFAGDQNYPLEKVELITSTLSEFFTLADI